MVTIKNVGYVPKKCLKICKNHIYCPIHKFASSDFSIYETGKCSSNSSMEFTPVSHDQAKNILILHNIDIKERQCIIKPYETMGDFSDDDKVVLDDGTEYFYTKDKNRKNTKELKVSIQTYCNRKALIKYKNYIYCKECYEKYVASKIGGPAIITLYEQSKLLEDYVSQPVKDEAECCSAETKKGDPCKNKAVENGMCRRHSQAINQ
jgi:hypothetical protein